MATSNHPPSTAYIYAEALTVLPVSVTTSEPVVTRTFRVRVSTLQPENYEVTGAAIVLANVRWRPTDPNAPQQPWFQVRFQDRWGEMTGASAILDSPDATPSMEAHGALREQCQLTEPCEWPITVNFVVQDDIAAEGTVDVELTASARVSLTGTSKPPKGLKVEVFAP